MLSQLRVGIREYVDGCELYDHVLERYAFAGNVCGWIERIGTFAEAGATKIRFSTERGDSDRQTKYMKMFADEILPKFQ